MIVVIHIFCIVLTILLIAANVRGWIGFVKADKRYRAEAGAETGEDGMADTCTSVEKNDRPDKTERSKVLRSQIWTTVNLLLIAPPLIVYSMVPQIIPFTPTVRIVCKVMGIIAIASSVAGLIYVIWNYSKWAKKTDVQDTSGRAAHSKGPRGHTDENASRNNSQDS